MRISRRSVLTLSLALVAVSVWAGSASAATVSVPAAGTGSSYYTDSGIFIPSGESVTVTASGTWSVCPPANCTSGPAGNSSYPPPGVPPYADPTAEAGTLIGSTNGASSWSAIGAGPTVVSGPGELLLTANDIPPSEPGGCGGPTGCYLDNTGSVTAVITFVATDKSQCKDGGWQTLTDANGTPFKNQGDCVSYVATGGRNPANG